MFLADAQYSLRIFLQVLSTKNIAPVGFSITGDIRNNIPIRSKRDASITQFIMTRSLLYYVRIGLALARIAAAAQRPALIRRKL